MRPGRSRTSTSLAIVDLAGLSAVILVTRAASAMYGTGVVPRTLLAGTAVLAAVGVVTHRRPRLLPPVDGATRPIATLGACALLVAAVLSFYPRSLLSPERLWLCAVVVLVIALGVAAARTLHLSDSSSCLRRRVIDAVVVIATVLVVTDLTDYSNALRYDYDFFLGPVNAMSHGRPLLVDTFSQYGVGIFYALAAAFHAVPLTYGGLQLILGFAYAAEFAVIYAVLRLTCTSQLVAVLGLGVALVANLAIDGAYIVYPSTGPLRFGLPWVVILAGTLRARSTEHRRLLDVTMVLTIGVAAVWSAETFVYALAAYASVTVFTLSVHAESRSQRALVLAKRIAAAIIAGFVAVGVTSAYILLLTGNWPRWTEYMSLVVLYAMRGFGSLLIPTWSPGYLVGAMYVLSLTALLALPRTVRLQHDRAIAATAGTTALGAIAFTYFLGRSAPTNLHHVAVPAVVATCGWWTITRPYVRAFGRIYMRTTVLAASCVCASIIASNSNDLGGWLGRTALLQGVQSPNAAVTELSRLLSSDETDPGVVNGARLLDTYSTLSRPPVVLVRADRLTAVLLAARRGNALPMVNANQERLIGAPALKRVTLATDRLPRGTVVLTETMIMRRPPESFAQLDPLRNHVRFGD